MESLSGKSLVMVVQPRQYWVSDNISSFLRGISFWYFLNNYMNPNISASLGFTILGIERVNKNS